MACPPTSGPLATILFLLLCQACSIAAQSTANGGASNAAATTSYSSYPTKPAAAGGTFAGDTTFSNSAPTDAAGENAAGASGGQGGSVNLSTGSVIAIVVVVVLVILFGGMIPDTFSCAACADIMKLRPRYCSSSPRSANGRSVSLYVESPAWSFGPRHRGHLDRNR